VVAAQRHEAQKLDVLVQKPELNVVLTDFEGTVAAKRLHFLQRFLQVLNPAL
jgi:hypothetical protein